MRDRTSTIIIGAVLMVLLVLGAGAGAFAILNATHVQHLECTVTDKDRTTKVSSDGNGGVTSSSDARVYTEDCGTLHVADSLLSWTWSSADTYSSIEPEHRYRFTTRGYRIPFLSMFPNVIDVEEVDQ